MSNQINEINEIINICKDFSEGIGIPLNGSGSLIVEPLSAYLNSIGVSNKIMHYEATEKTPLILVLVFKGFSITPDASSHGVDKVKDWHIETMK